MFSRSVFDNAAVGMHRGAVALRLFFVASSSLLQELKEFSNGEVADADDVNFNFTLLKDAIDALALEPTSTIIAAEGSPSGDTGEVGDVYIDTASYDFYGPKDIKGALRVISSFLEFCSLEHVSLCFARTLIASKLIVIEL